MEIKGTFVAASHRGYDLKIYDDGDGPIWIAGNESGPAYAIRAHNLDTALAIYEDEYAIPAFDDDIIRDYWPHFLDEMKLSQDPYDVWLEDALNPETDEPLFEDFQEQFWDWLHNDACFQESYGYRPNGGMYVKDEYFWINEATAIYLQNHDIQIQVIEEQDND